MTQHILEQDTQEDQQTLHRLAAVTAGFLGFTIVMAVIIGLVLG
ncbi:MAG: hypothetical protein V7742_18320 [Halioglobus sp.]